MRYYLAHTKRGTHVHAADLAQLPKTYGYIARCGVRVSFQWPLIFITDPAKELTCPKCIKRKW